MDAAEEATPHPYLKAFQLVISVHDQLRLVPVDSDQNHVVWTVVHIAAHQLVGGTVSEGLEETYRRLTAPVFHTW